MNGAGDVATVVYGGGTPGLTNTYDQAGRLSTVYCNGITNTLSYDLANDPLGETYSGGVLNGLASTNGFDGLLRRMNNSVVNSGTAAATTVHSDRAFSRGKAMSRAPHWIGMTKFPHGPATAMIKEMIINMP